MYDTLESSPSATSPGDHSPSFTTLDLNDLKLYGTTPLELGPAGHALFKCKECGRPVLENALSDHQGSFLVSRHFSS